MFFFFASNYHLTVDTSFYVKLISWRIFGAFMCRHALISTYPNVVDYSLKKKKKREKKMEL